MEIGEKRSVYNDKHFETNTHPTMDCLRIHTEYYPKLDTSEITHILVRIEHPPDF